MSVPATTTTVLIFMGGVATGIILIVTILLCCRIKSRHKYFQSRHGFLKRSKSQIQQSTEDHQYYDRNPETSFDTNDDVYSKRYLQEGIQSNLKEVPIISSLNDIIDVEGCPTAHQCNIVQIQIDSNKSFKFYSHYDTSSSSSPHEKESSKNPTKAQSKNDSHPTSTVIPSIKNSLELAWKTKKTISKSGEIESSIRKSSKDRSRGQINVVSCDRRLSLKCQERLAHSASLTDALNLSPSLLKFNSRFIKSMPNVSIDFGVPIRSSKLPVDDRKNSDQQSRRISFRKKLHNLKKYIDESIAENICSGEGAARRSDESARAVEESSAAASNERTERRGNAQEMSKELWQLRAMFADADELESEDSPPSTPHNNNNNSEEVRNDSSPSCEPRPIDRRTDASRNGRASPTLVESIKGGRRDPSNDRQAAVGTSESRRGSHEAETKGDEDESTIQKKPSVRRQIYRNAIARQQQKNVDQHLDDPSKLESKREGLSASEEAHNNNSNNSRPSLESFKAAESEEIHNSRLERLRGDSGYKSLENQHSLRTSFQLIIQESNATGEEEERALGTRVVPESRTTPSSQILTRRVHSADETFVKIPLSLLSSTEDADPSCDKSAKKSNNGHLDYHSFFVKERRHRDRLDQKTSQNFFSQSKSKNHLATSSELVSMVKPIFCNASLLSSTSSFASSLFSRFLKSHSRRTYARTQRDYSIDERSDAIFNEFLRFDPSLEARHVPASRSSPRGRQRLQRYKLSDKYSPVPVVVPRSPDKESGERTVKKTPRVSHGVHGRGAGSAVPGHRFEMESFDTGQTDVVAPMEGSSAACLEVRSEKVHLAEDSADKDATTTTATSTAAAAAAATTARHSSIKYIPVIQLTEEE